MSKSVNRLKDLLLDEEHSRLDEFERRLEGVEHESRSEQLKRLDTAQRIDQLFQRAGTEERFRRSVADVIDVAIQDAETTRHAQLSRAVAPLVVNTIKTELKNSQDEMVEALYPITGRMVSAYVASAMKDLAESINRRLSQNPVSLRMRSLTTGRPVSELVMADTQRLEVEELFLMRRGSGELIARWPGGTDLSNSDVHMSGVLTAISDFAAHAFQNDGGGIRSFRADDFQIFMRASPVYLLAAKCRGVAPPGLEKIFDEEFLAVLERDPTELEPDHFSGPSGEDHRLQLVSTSDALSRRIENRYEALDQEGGGFFVLKLLLFLILVPLIAWFAWGWYTDMEEHRVRRIAQSVVADTPAVEGYPLNIGVGYRGKTLVVDGLLANDDIRSDLRSRLASRLPENTVIAGTVAVLPEQETTDNRPLIARLNRQIATLENELEQSAQAILARAERMGLMRLVERSRSRLRQALAELQTIKPEGKGREQRAQRVGMAANDTKRVLAQLGKLSGQLSGGVTLDDGQRSRVAGLLNTASATLDGAVRNINLVLAPDTLPPDSVRSNPSDPIIAAEEVSANTERLASTVSAVRQASQIRIPPPPPPPPAQVVEREPSAEDRLRRWVTRNAIFFEKDTDYRNPKSAEKTLGELAALMKQVDIPIRVVGYTDERGRLDRNTTLAQERAATVVLALINQGILPSRLVAVGRANGRDLSPGSGEASPNRRVEFELPFAGEFADAAKR